MGAPNVTTASTPGVNTSGQPSTQVPLLAPPGTSFNNVATYSTDASGNVTGLVGSNGGNIAQTIYAALTVNSPSAASANTAVLQALAASFQTSGGESFSVNRVTRAKKASSGRCI